MVQAVVQADNVFGKLPIQRVFTMNYWWFSSCYGERRCWAVQRARDQEAEEVLSETEALLRKPGQVLQAVDAG